jgi:hypothetical protein
MTAMASDEGIDFGAPRPLIDARAPKRQSANAESEAVQSSQIWPARHPPTEAPTRAQRRDPKVAERRWSATIVQRPWCVTGALTRRRQGALQGKGWKLNRSKSAPLGEAAELLRRIVGIWRNCDNPGLTASRWRIQWRMLVRPQPASAAGSSAWLWRVGGLAGAAMENAAMAQTSGGHEI